MFAITVRNPNMKNMTKDENLDSYWKKRGKRYKLQLISTMNQ